MNSKTWRTDNKKKRTVRKTGAGLLLALVLVMMMGMSVFAADQTTISVEGSNGSVTLENHEFKAYPILTGTISDGKYTELSWANAATPAAFLTATKGSALEADFAGYTAETLTATEFADVVGGYQNAQAEELSKVIGSVKASLGTPVAVQYGTATTLASGGYYYVEDTTKVEGQDDAANRSLLFAVTGGENKIKVKTDKPALEKTIYHNEKDTYEMVGDNQIGDAVWFRIVTTVPDYSQYDTYSYTIHDTLSKGLKLDTASVKTFTTEQSQADLATAAGVDFTKVEAPANIDDANPTTFTVAIDLKDKSKDHAAGAQKLYTYYKATVTGNAVVYTEGSQNNTAYLTYTNNPNGEGVGKTPEAKVYDWTFQMGVHKVDAADKSKTLQAKFVLSKEKDQKFVYTAANGATPESVSNTQNAIAVVKNADGSYRVATSADTDNQTYVIEAGNVTIKGLDDATTYYLYEVKAQDGYNLLKDPVTFTINTAYNADGSSLAENKPTVIVGTAKESTTLSTVIENHSGTILPSTGGVGTTMFYVCGAVLISGAAAMLIIRKKKEEK